MIYIENDHGLRFTTNSYVSSKVHDIYDPSDIDLCHRPVGGNKRYVGITIIITIPIQPATPLLPYRHYRMPKVGHERYGRNRHQKDKYPVSSCSFFNFFRSSSCLKQTHRTGITRSTAMCHVTFLRGKA